MKLTPEEIAKIDETLVLNKVIFNDIKLELTDHIASDIEETMTSQEVPYEAAFKEAFENSDELFEPLRDKFTGKDIGDTPKLVSGKLSNQVKNIFFQIILCTICITALFIGVLKTGNSETLKDGFYLGYKMIYGILTALLFTGIKLVKVDKKRITTFFGVFLFFFSFTMYPLIGIMLLMVVFNSFFFHVFNANGFGDYLTLGFLTYFPIQGLMAFWSLYKHFQFEKKLSKV